MAASRAIELRQYAKGEMKLQNKKKALLAMALAAFAASPATAWADDTAAEIRLLKARLKQLEPLKAQLKQLEAKVAKQDRERKETEARVRHGAAPPPPPMVCKDAPCPPPPELPPPVWVSFKNGLNVESFDHDFSFRIGGRVFVDGGGSTQPELGKSGTANITSARLQEARRSNIGTTSSNMNSRGAPLSPAFRGPARPWREGSGTLTLR